MFFIHVIEVEIIFRSLTDISLFVCVLFQIILNQHGVNAFIGSGCSHDQGAEFFVSNILFESGVVGVLIVKPFFHREDQKKESPVDQKNAEHQPEQEENSVFKIRIGNR